MSRQTKIIATLGPATDRTTVLKKMIESEVNVVRLNFSHGLASDHERRATNVRTLAKELDKTVAILGDLQGPKIRISGFTNNKVNLRNGKLFTFDAELDAAAGDENAVGISYPPLIDDCSEGDILLLDDGRLRLRVEAREKNKLITRVVAGGELSDRKGINRLGGGINAPSLTAKDLEDIAVAKRMGCDYLALSFVRNKGDIAILREHLAQLDFSPYIVAKIERSEAVANQETTDGIIRASECIMVARGDLGVELGEARLVGVQKRLIARAVELNRSVITATQMMESMIHNIIPTRAEVFDVANAVLDCTDAVMLSAETASGKHPVRVVQAMDEICIGAEEQLLPSSAAHLISDKMFYQPDEAIAYSSLHTALQLEGVRAIVTFTESGNTPMWISRIRSKIPIIGISRNPATLGRMAMWRGVFPILYDITSVKRSRLLITCIRLAASKVQLKAGDKLILTRGNRAGISGTDRMQIVTITSEHLAQA